MPNQTYQGIQHVVELSSSVGKQCEHCAESVGFSDEPLTGSVNHYIAKHGYQLLHVGSQTSRDNDGNPFHSTVAVVGK